MADKYSEDYQVIINILKNWEFENDKILEAQDQVKLKKQIIESYKSSPED